MALLIGRDRSPVRLLTERHWPPPTSREASCGRADGIRGVSETLSGGRGGVIRANILHLKLSAIDWSRVTPDPTWTAPAESIAH
ncbi:unnamed protein product [Gadus morhua 'NCC']